jgi:hypothetical protein
MPLIEELPIVDESWVIGATPCPAQLIVPPGTLLGYCLAEPTHEPLYVELVYASPADVVAHAALAAIHCARPSPRRPAVVQTPHQPLCHVIRRVFGSEVTIRWTADPIDQDLLAQLVHGALCIDPECYRGPCYLPAS